MGKTKKKSKSTARGTGSSRGVAPIDFEAAGKNNPPFRFVCLFPDNPGLTMVMPIEHIPKLSFQCGLESKSIHFVAQEAIRSILTTGLKSILPAYDDTVGDIIETIIEEHYKEDATGKDFFQFLLTNSADPNLRYTFRAVSNFLPVKHTDNQTQLMVACIVPKAVTTLLQTIVLSECHDDPEDEFFEDCRNILPANLQTAYDTYLRTPVKNRHFEKFSHSLTCDQSFNWNSFYQVYCQDRQISSLCVVGTRFPPSWSNPFVD